MSDSVDSSGGLEKLDVKRVRLTVAGLLAAGAAVAGAVALLGGSSGSSAGSSSAAVALSSAQLLARAGGLSGTAYWLGPRTDTTSYELSDSSDGRIFIRYLTGGAKAGDPRPDFLTVGTYPVPSARRALARGAATDAKEGTLSRLPGREILGSAKATSAYVVFDEEPELQIEVFSPRRGQAARLAESGALELLR